MPISTSSLLERKATYLNLLATTHDAIKAAFGGEAPATRTLLLHSERTLRLRIRFSTRLTIQETDKVIADLVRELRGHGLSLS